MPKYKNKNIIILIIILSFFYIDEEIPNFQNENNLLKREPKISVIIPLYNGGKYLNYSLCSVLNQTLKDIEIIIIDDNSNDDSLKIIKTYMEKDERIILIKNKENKKILFCKSIGVLNSKGKYIFILDQDDMIIRDDAFDLLYNECEQNNLDLIKFKHKSVKFGFTNNFFSNSNRIQNYSRFNITKFKNPFSVLWIYLIRSDLYKKIIYNLWPIIINYKIIFQEDFLITFFFFTYVRKYKSIKDLLYFHYLHEHSASYRYKNNSDFLLSVIFAGIILCNYYAEPYSQYFQNIINYFYSYKSEINKLKNLNPSLFKILIENLLSNNINKKFLMNILNSSENYDLNVQFNLNINLNVTKPLLTKKKNIPKKINSFLQLSIIFIYSNFDSFIKIINYINAQNINNFEIIIIYDDEKKRGKLFSISEGIMFAIGKYLIIFQSECFFIHDDGLKNLFEIIEKEDIDILEFNLYIIYSNNYTHLYKCKHFKAKFNTCDENTLKIKYNFNMYEINRKEDLLINKIFKTSFFKNVIKQFNLDKIKESIDFYYNNIFNFILESSRHEFKHINSIKIFSSDIYLEKTKFNGFISNQDKIRNETIFYINFIFDNSKDSFAAKNKVLKEFLNVLSIIFNKFSNNSKSELTLLHKFIKCKYISKKNKDNLYFYFNSLIK